jgi:hypothetical protein
LRSWTRFGTITGQSDQSRKYLSQKNWGRSRQRLRNQISAKLACERPCRRFPAKLVCERPVSQEISRLWSLDSGISQTLVSTSRPDSEISRLWSPDSGINQSTLSLDRAEQIENPVDPTLPNFQKSTICDYNSKYPLKRVQRPKSGNLLVWSGDKVWKIPESGDQSLEISWSDLETKSGKSPSLVTKVWKSPGLVWRQSLENPRV